MSCEENTKILEAAYEMGAEFGVPSETMKAWDLEAAFEFLVVCKNCPIAEEIPHELA